MSQSFVLLKNTTCIHVYSLQHVVLVRWMSNLHMLSTFMETERKNMKDTNAG
jgi:hypothetical protein